MGRISILPLVLKRHWLPALVTFASVVGSSLAYVALTPSTFEASGRLMLNQQQTGVSDLSRDLTQLPDGRASGANPVITQAELVKSQRVLERAIYLYESEVADPEPITPAALRGRLDVTIIPATNILELTYTGQEPELAAQLLNAVLQATAEENAESIRIEASSVRQFLESEVPRQRARLEQAETAENEYRQSSGIIEVTEQKQALIERLSDIESEENNIAFQLREAAARSNYLQQVTGVDALRSAYAAVRVGQDEQLQGLRTTLAELESQVIEARSRLGDQHPDLLAIVERRDATRQRYADEVARVMPGSVNVPSGELALDELSQKLSSDYIVGELERQALQERLGTVQRARVNLEQQLVQFPRREQSLTTLVRRREEAAATLQQLQAKLDEARIAEAQLVSNIRVIDSAQVPTLAVWPKLSVILVIASAAGLGLAIAVVILLEALNRTFDDAIEVEELTKLPVLGVLPELPSTALVLGQPDRFLNDSALVEPYRTLLRVLDSRVSRSPKVIVITSAMRGEGKSTIASHLAAISALLSHRTLLIDANLNQPAQQSVFGLSAQPGLTHVVRDGCALLESVQSTNIESLSVLTHGEVSSRPSAVIESAAMRALLAEATNHYDLVVIDSPSISSSADAVTLGQYSDGILMVARPNFTPKDRLRRIVSGLTGSGMSVLGVAINGAKSRREEFYPKISSTDVQSNGFKRLASPDVAKDSVNVR